MSTEIDVLDGLTTNIPTGNWKIVIGSHDNVTIGNGTDTITAGDSDNITIGSIGNSTLVMGSHDTVTAGQGPSRLAMAMIPWSWARTATSKQATAMTS